MFFFLIFLFKIRISRIVLLYLTIKLIALFWYFMQARAIGLTSRIFSGRFSSRYLFCDTRSLFR